MTEFPPSERRARKGPLPREKQHRAFCTFLKRDVCIFLNRKRERGRDLEGLRAGNQKKNTFLQHTRTRKANNYATLVDIEAVNKLPKGGRALKL